MAKVEPVGKEYLESIHEMLLILVLNNDYEMYDLIEKDSGDLSEVEDFTLVQLQAIESYIKRLRPNLKRNNPTPDSSEELPKVVRGAKKKEVVEFLLAGFSVEEVVDLEIASLQYVKWINKDLWLEEIFI